MLDVHPPEHGIHNVREFLLHLFTITCGLLIALALENAAEAVHHRRERREAEEKIRQELGENQQQIRDADQVVKEEISDLSAILKFLQARSKGQPGDATHLRLSYTVRPTKDAAWRTASATGVLSYMPYDLVQRFATAYHTQDELQLLNRETLNEYLQLESYVVTGFDPGSLSADDVKTALPQVRQTVAHLGAMRDYDRSILADYADALK